MSEPGIECGRWKPRVETQFQPAALVLLFLLCLCLPLHARSHALVVLADGLTLADITRPDLPHLAALQQSSALALMSSGLARTPDPVANVYATLGAGDSVRVGDVSQGRLNEALLQASVPTALIGQNIGPSSPVRLILPYPSITVVTADPVRAATAAQSAFGTCDLVIVHFTDAGAGRDALLHRLDVFFGLALKTSPTNVFLVVPTPPLLPDGTWNRLTPFLAYHPTTVPFGWYSYAYVPVAQSPTTQSYGLVASRDFAPTVLDVLGIPAPSQMTGAAIEPSGGTAEEALPRLRRLEETVRLNQEAQTPVFWTVGLGASAIVFSTLGLLLAGRMGGWGGHVSRYGVCVIAAWPLALLLAPLWNPLTLHSYLVVILVATALLAFLPSPPVIFGLTALVLVGDGLTGTTLVSNSALSEYALSGIRFYGIGNEYMGVLIGGALLLCVGVGVGSPRPTMTAFWFALVTFVLSFPAFGAKAGGAVTATATFVIAWRLLQGKKVNWKWALGGLAAGFALVFVWAVLSHVLHLRRTHLETATDALGSGRFGYIVGVSLRKIGLAARVILHPGTLLGLLAFAAMGVVLRRLLWDRVQGYITSHPRERIVYLSGLWGCLVALLFNDSGIVAAILILQCLALTLLHGLYGDALEEQNASAGA